MALTELQMPAKDAFYNRIRNSASQINNLILRWGELSEFLQMMDTNDMDTMQIPAGQIRTDLIDFRIMLDETIQYFEGNTVVPTKVPIAVIDRLRSM